MIRLEETYDGEIISLKKGKKGHVTIKLKLNHKEDNKNVGFFTRKRREIANVSGGSSGNFRSVEENEQNHTGTKEASTNREEQGENV